MALQVTFTGNEKFDYLRVDPGYDDAIVNRVITTAILEAETFLNTDFSTTVTNEDGTTTTTPNEAPETVKTWILDRAAQLYENRGVAIKPNYDLLQPFRVYPFKGV